jgi:hypothetical protein
MINRKTLKESKKKFSELIEPKFRDSNQLSSEQLTDPDYALKRLEQEHGQLLPITCTKCHHCR